MRCWVFSKDASAPCVPVHLRAQIWPQISYNLGARSSALSAAPRSRFCLTTAAVSIPTLYTIAPTTRGASIRSFAWSGTDRPFRPICSSPFADFPTRCVRSLHNQLVLRLPHSDAVHTIASKPKLSAALSQSAPMLSSTCSRRAGRSSVDSERWLGGSSVPASFLQQTSRHNGPL